MESPSLVKPTTPKRAASSRKINFAGDAGTMPQGKPALGRKVQRELALAIPRRHRLWAGAQQHRHNLRVMACRGVVQRQPACRVHRDGRPRMGFQQQGQNLSVAAPSCHVQGQLAALALGR